MVLICVGWTLPATAQDGRALVSSSNSGASAFTGVNINEFVGAHRFYDAGYTGASALLGNIEGSIADTTHNAMTNVTNTFLGTGVSGSTRNHAAASTHAMAGALSAAYSSSNYYGFGVSHGSEVWIGGIATSFNSDGSYNLTPASTASTYVDMLKTGIDGRTVDVFNSSWGFTNPGGNRRDTMGVDALINQNRTVGVVSAGNSGSGTNTVGGYGAGYNSITVGATAGDTSTPAYGAVAGFSSRSPNEFLLATGINSWSTISSAVSQRAAVDIVAPGQNMTLAKPESGNNWYGFNWQGTSFAAPTVAGGAGLVVDTGKNLYGTEDAIDGRVVKSVLLNSANKLTGWNNGQSNVAGVIQTTQSLDFEQGAGQLNLNQAFDQYVNLQSGGMAATTDVTGTLQGDLGDVGAVGWDFGQVDAGDSNYYFIDSMLEANSEFTVTLSWFADRSTGSLASFFRSGEEHFADLNLSVFEFDNLVDRNIKKTTAESISLYNVVEHLDFSILARGFYGIEVNYASAHWNFSNETDEQYGLSWVGTAIPEPGAVGILALFYIAAVGRRRRMIVA